MPDGQCNSEKIKSTLGLSTLLEVRLATALQNGQANFFAYTLLHLGAGRGKKSTAPHLFLKLHKEDMLLFKIKENNQ
uniref:Uncharacterized protein n=1 Tax=viral metagenome TaxID=1070528 RepID=A0A6M3JCH8_9ZZZZ